MRRGAEVEDSPVGEPSDGALPVGLAAWAATPRTAYVLAFLAVALPASLSVLAGRSVGWVVIWSVFGNFVLLGIIVMLTTTLKRRLARNDKHRALQGRNVRDRRRSAGRHCSA